MTRFVKSKDGAILARLLGFRPVPASKQVWVCCPACDDGPVAEIQGFMIEVGDFTGGDLNRLGLKTSSDRHSYAVE